MYNVSVRDCNLGNSKRRARLEGLELKFHRLFMSALVPLVGGLSVELACNLNCLESKIALPSGASLHQGAFEPWAVRVQCHFDLQL
jgi:hypothetical protein